MKLYAYTAAIFLLVGSSFAFAGNGKGQGAADAAPQPQPQSQEQNMYNEQDTVFGKPAIAGDGIQNATQVVNPTDIGNGSTTAVAPEPQPTEGDVGVQTAK